MSPNRRVVVAVLALALGALACSNPTSRIAERTREMPKTVAVVTSTYVPPETVAAPATVAPEEAARRWREAVAELDYVAIEALTCSAEQVNFQNDALWISALSQLRRTRTGDELEAEVTDLYFETISIDEDRAAVRVSGPMEAELLSYAHMHAVAETWSMVKEGGRWKWCGSEGPAQVTGTAVGEARLFVEYAKVLGRDEGMREAETLLSSARRINPFDVEYSASLARIYRAWADMTQDAETRDEMMQRSSLNYDIATTRSPANAILWTEWAMLYLCTRQFEKAQDTITHSLEIDPEYEQTWTVQGNIYANRDMLDDALAAYETALELDPKRSRSGCGRGTSTASRAAGRIRSRPMRKRWG